MLSSPSDLPFARVTHTHVCTCASACIGAYIRIHTYELAAVASLEQGGIIRSATINPNDDDAVMTLSRTSFQAMSVTLRAHLSLFSHPLHSLACRLYVPLSFVIHTYLYLYPDFYMYFYPSPSSSSVSIFDSLSFSFFPLCPHIVLSNSFLVYPFLSFLSSSNFLFYHGVFRGKKLSRFHNRPARFVNNSSRPLRRDTAITSFMYFQ